jgi:cation diffusion facilitator family transporter
MEINRESLVQKVAWISLISNVLLTVGKLLVGSYGGSEGVFTDGIHSGADVLASIIVLLVIKISNKPADDEHPYGHGKAEIIVSGIVGILLLMVSFYIIFEALNGFFKPVKAPGIIAMWVAVFSYVAKLFLYKRSLKISKEQNSRAIEAIAFDHKADIAASIAAASGVIISILGMKWDIHFLLFGDKIASIIVAILIFRLSKEMLVEAFNILLERNIETTTLNRFIEIIQTFPEVKRIDKIRAREHGHYILVDLRISIDHDKTIKEGHDLTREIKFALMNQYDTIEEVLIHLNPYFPE